MSCRPSNVLEPLHLVRLPSATTPQQTDSVDVVGKKWSSDAAESQRWEMWWSSADQHYRKTRVNQVSSRNHSLRTGANSGRSGNARTKEKCHSAGTPAELITPRYGNLFQLPDGQECRTGLLRFRGGEGGLSWLTELVFGSHGTHSETNNYKAVSIHIRFYTYYQGKRGKRVL